MIPELYCSSGSLCEGLTLIVVSCPYMVNVMNTSTVHLIAPKAIEHLTTLLTESQRQDVASYGVQRVAPNMLTYYHETWEFFNKFEDEIEDYFYDKYGQNWLAKFAGSSTSVRGMVNHMVWSFVNQICKELTGIH